MVKSRHKMFPVVCLKKDQEVGVEHHTSNRRSNERYHSHKVHVLFKSDVRISIEQRGDWCRGIHLRVSASPKRWPLFLFCCFVNSSGCRKTWIRMAAVSLEDPHCHGAQVIWETWSESNHNYRLCVLPVNDNHPGEPAARLTVNEKCNADPSQASVAIFLLQLKGSS